ANREPLPCDVAVARNLDAHPIEAIEDGVELLLPYRTLPALLAGPPEIAVDPLQHGGCGAVEHERVGVSGAWTLDRRETEVRRVDERERRGYPRVVGIRRPE